MVSEDSRSEYGTGHVCTTCFASVERYVALKMKYIELETALMSKMSTRGMDMYSPPTQPILSERSFVASIRQDSVA